MAMLRVILLSMLAAVAIVDSSVAAPPTQTYVSAEQIISSDARVARTIRSFKRDGYVEAGRVYHQVMYFVAPTEDYKAGEYIITLRKSAGNYSLTTYYADVHVEIMADVETGRYFVGRLWTEESVVY